MRELGYTGSPALCCIVYTDNCCGDHGLLNKAFPGLADGGLCTRACELPPLELGPNEAIYIAEQGHADAALADAFSGERRPSAIGIDLEWVPKNMQNAAAVGNPNSGKVCLDLTKQHI